VAKPAVPRKKSSAKRSVGQDSIARPAGHPLWLKKAETFLPALIAAAGILAYHNSLQGPFIFDDRYHIVENVLIRKLWPPWPLLLHSSRPTVLLSLAVNYAFGGLNPLGYHVFNVLIHILAALVLFGVVRRTFLSPPLRPKWSSAAPWLAALISSVWLVHPLQTESVTYTIQRGESMMGLFYLLTLYCAIRMNGCAEERNGKLPGAMTRAGWWWMAAAVTSCLLGMATKGGVMVTAPILVLLYDRAFLSPSWRELARRRLLYGALAATWASYPFLLAAAPAEWKDSAGFAYAGAGPLQYAMTQPGVILHYLRLAIWPDGLCLDYGWAAAHSAGEVWPQLIALAGLLWGCVWAWRRDPPLGFLGAWFFIILVPTSSFIPIADAAVEHRMYLPLAAVVTLFAVAVAFLLQRRGNSWMLGGIVGILTVLVLAGLTVRRNLDYVSKVAIWQDAVNKSPNNPRAHYDLGVALEEVDKIPDATAEYRQAVQLNPNYAEALNNLGHLLSTTGRPADAVEYLQRAIRIQPNLATAHNLLGYALALQGNVQEAVSQWHTALSLKPDYAEPHTNLGMVLVQEGKLPEAIVEWKQALQCDPNAAEPNNNLAYSLWQEGDVRGAILHYEQAIRVKPDYFQALVSFAKLLANPGPGADADPARAVSLAQRACELPGHRDAACLDTLASCHASANRMEDAVRTAETALGLARSAGELDLAKQIEAHLEVYRGKLRGGLVAAPGTFPPR
jgi:Flp pilus assembly protein TadD